MAALRTGLSIHAAGYNLFVSGLIGSGRTAVVEMLLRDIQPVCRRVPDRVFVHNFAEPNRPVLVSLPAGRAAWVQIVRGTLRVDGEALSEGDGLAIHDEEAVRSFRVEGDAGAEALFLELPRVSHA